MSVILHSRKGGDKDCGSNLIQNGRSFPTPSCFPTHFTNYDACSDCTKRHYRSRRGTFFISMWVSSAQEGHGMSVRTSASSRDWSCRSRPCNTRPHPVGSEPADPIRLYSRTHMLQAIPSLAHTLQSSLCPLSRIWSRGKKASEVECLELRRVRCLPSATRPQVP